jgi:hypothetical protein
MAYPEARMLTQKGKPMDQHYLHHVTGRVRARTPALKRNPVGAERILKLFAPVDGVLFVEVKTLTGSVTVFYDPGEIEVARIIEMLCTTGYLDLAKLIPAERSLDLAASRAGQVLARAAAGLVIDRLLGSTPLGILAAIV